MEVEVTDNKLETFDADCQKALSSLVKAQDFWREALKRNIEIPYSAHRDVPSSLNYVNLAQHDDYDVETQQSPLNIEETQKQFARVIRWARENNWPVEKKYTDDEFNIIVRDTPIGRINFYSTRQVVCKRVEVGTRTEPAKEVPIYEYQCDKVAFLKVEV